LSLSTGKRDAIFFTLSIAVLTTDNAYQKARPTPTPLGVFWKIFLIKRKFFMVTTVKKNPF